MTTNTKGKLKDDPAEEAALPHEGQQDEDCQRHPKKGRVCKQLFQSASSLPATPKKYKKRKARSKTVRP
jgi:hypothetical protein